MGTPSRSSTRPSMAEVRTRFGWMMLSALVMRSHSLTAPTEVLENMTATTLKMLVLNAQVTHGLFVAQKHQIGKVSE